MAPIEQVLAMSKFGIIARWLAGTNHHARSCALIVGSL